MTATADAPTVPAWLTPGAPVAIWSQNWPHKPTVTHATVETVNAVQVFVAGDPSPFALPGMARRDNARLLPMDDPRVAEAAA